MKTGELKYLLERYFHDEATHADREALYQALEENANKEQWEALMLELVPADRPLSDLDPKYEKMLREIIAVRSKVKKIQPRHWLWAAASLALILFSAVYFYAVRNEREPVVVATQRSDVPAPQVNRATITLSDGSTVFLDSVDRGQVALQGHVMLVKLADGQVVYRGGNNGPSEMRYNTLMNPTGSKVIDITLSDGSRVWLNAGTSLTYPVAFTGMVRKVEVNGEAYFEVASDKDRPFYVSKGGVTVSVTGTHFNVMAYDEEPDIRVTLLEGSVRVSNEKGMATLTPGHQAKIVAGQSPLIVNDVNLDQVMAWKNGRFVFDELNIHAVMRQLARWYDVEVSYRGDITHEEFIGVISRSRFDSITKILDKLEMTKTVSFKVVGRHVTVMPYQN